MQHPTGIQFFIVLVSLVAISWGRSAKHTPREGFFNHTGCLYAYQEQGSFEMLRADGESIEANLTLDSLTYDAVKSNCTGANGESGMIVFSFEVPPKNTKLKAISISMKITPSLSEGFWEISRADLTVFKADSNKKRTFSLQVEDIYASLMHSYSCSALVLRTQHNPQSKNETGSVEPRAAITLRRFQLQPFQEQQNAVFASSFDCSTWISVPGLMGLILILFVTVVTIIGVDFLKKIEINDFKFNKESQLFTQSQMDSNKR